MTMLVSQLIISAVFEGIVHSEMRIAKFVLAIQAIQDVDEFVSSSRKILRNLALH